MSRYAIKSLVHLELAPAYRTVASLLARTRSTALQWKSVSTLELSQCPNVCRLFDAIRTACEAQREGFDGRYCQRVPDAGAHSLGG